MRFFEYSGDSGHHSGGKLAKDYSPKPAKVSGDLGQP